jgi:AraC-like DNA-binding protein
MNFEVFAADLPRQWSQWFTSPEALEKALKQVGIYQPTRQAKGGKFRAGLAYRAYPECELFSDRYSTDLSLYLKSPEVEVGILLPRSPSNHFVINGINLGDDQLAVAQLGEGMNISGPGPIGSDCIIMSESRFIEMLETLCPTASALKGLTLVKVFAPELRTLGDLIVNLIGAPEEGLQSERITNLLAWTVSLLGHASDQYRPESINGLKSRSRVAKDARDYMEMNFQMPVHLEELCKHTGVGVRTLQRCFREYFEHTITDYLKTVRLDAAYRELAGGDSRETNVTEVALSNGFTHLGRFSVDYRTRFGESPSETLGV